MDSITVDVRRVPERKGMRSENILSENVTGELGVELFREKKREGGFDASQPRKRKRTRREEEERTA